MPLHPRQAAGANALGDEGQALDDLLFWRPATIEDRPFGLGEDLPAGPALVSLTALLGPTSPLDVSLLIGPEFAKVGTGFIWTETTNSSKVRHHPS